MAEVLAVGWLAMEPERRTRPTRKLALETGSFGTMGLALEPTRSWRYQLPTSCTVEGRQEFGLVRTMASAALASAALASVALASVASASVASALASAAWAWAVGRARRMTVDRGSHTVVVVVGMAAGMVEGMVAGMEVGSSRRLRRNRPIPSSL